MRELDINNTIEIIDKVLLPKSNYENKEIFPFVKFNSYCKTCNQINTIIIRPFETGHALSNLFVKNILSKELILKHGVAKKAAKWQSHLGELILFNVPALYTFNKCGNCNQLFLLVFGIGEVQPGRMVCQISGLWRVKEKK